jgi:hypothetical protein
MALVLARKADDLPVQSLQNDVLADYCRQAQIVTRVVKSLQDEMKRRLTEGEVTPELVGFGLKNGAWRRSITNNLVALEALSELITGNELLECSNVKFSELQDLAVKRLVAKGLTKAAAMQEFMRLIALAFEEKQNAPSLYPLK